MYLLPFYIKKYKTKGSADCFVKKIRANTVYMFNENGGIRGYNPNQLPFRNEKDKGIYLKGIKKATSKYGQGTTAIFISENNGQTIVSTIAYNGTQESIALGLLLIAVLYNIINGSKNLEVIVACFFMFMVLFGTDNYRLLRKHKKLVEKAIEACEMD